MTLEVKISGKYRGIYAATECDLLCRIVPKAQYAMTIALYSWGSRGAVSPQAGPGQSAGGVKHLKALKNLKVERYLLGKLKLNCNSMSYQATEGSAVK